MPVPSYHVGKPKKLLLGYVHIDIGNDKILQVKIDDWDEYHALLQANLIEVLQDQVPDIKHIEDMPSLDHNFIIVKCDQKDIRWKRTSRYVHKCLVKAADDFLQHWFGRKLDRHDDNWYEGYADKVDNNGCKEKWTATVLHQLLAPYEIGVRRIFLPKNAPLSPEMYTWMARIGVNPTAAKDCSTSNEEFFASMGMDDESLSKLPPEDQEAMRQARNEMSERFGIEFVDEPPGPCILLSTFSNSSTSYYSSGSSRNGGYYGGSSYTLTTSSHNGGAFYNGPRAGGKSTWKMAIQLGWLKDMPYNEIDVPLDPYKKDSGLEVPECNTLKIYVDANGKKYDIWQCRKYIKDQRDAKKHAEDKAKRDAKTPKFTAIRELVDEFGIKLKEAKAVYDAFKGDMAKCKKFLINGSDLPQFQGVVETTSYRDNEDWDMQTAIPMSPRSMTSSQPWKKCNVCQQWMQPILEGGELSCSECNTTMTSTSVAMGNPPNIAKSL